MNQDFLDQVNQIVFQNFPQVMGINPEQLIQPNQTILLIYKKTAYTEDGHTMPIIIRVVVDKSGKILKTTTSR
jgi:hypothetical protein